MSRAALQRMSLPGLFGMPACLASQDIVAVPAHCPLHVCSAAQDVFDMFEPALLALQAACDERTLVSTRTCLSCATML